MPPPPPPPPPRPAREGICWAAFVRDKVTLAECGQDHHGGAEPTRVDVLAVPQPYRTHGLRFGSRLRTCGAGQLAPGVRVPASGVPHVRVPCGAPQVLAKMVPSPNPNPNPNPHQVLTLAKKILSKKPSPGWEYERSGMKLKACKLHL